MTTLATCGRRPLVLGRQSLKLQPFGTARHKATCQQRGAIAPRAALPAQATELLVNAAISFAGAPPEVLLGGGALVLATAGLLVFAAVQQKGAQGQQEAAPAAAKGPPRRNAVLVLGATGRTGRVIVQTLLRQGRTVVAGVRSAERARELFGGLGLSEGVQAGGGQGVLFIEGGLDATDPATLGPKVFRGVSQVVSAVGAVFGRTADGQMGYLDNMTSERVDAQGNSNIAAAAAAHMARAQRATADVLPMRSGEDLARWQRLDDVIMGGQSSSALVAAESGGGAVWTGQLIVEGGGFCGARTLPVDVDLSPYDGVLLRVRSDGGQTFKLNIKTDAQISVPEDTYQATFETRAGEWATVHLPWHEFVPVKRARSIPGGPPLDPARIRQFGLVLSRFDFNGFANPRYQPGAFQLEIEGGIGAYWEPRPQLLLVGSAGVERNARIGDDEEARKKDIPIVQLNPGSVLNHKYSGENAVRGAGLPYCVVRPTGLVQQEGAAGEPALLETHQGDLVSGKVTRQELADVVAAALGTPAAADKTFELRRSEAADAQGKATGEREMLRLFLGLAADRHRQRVGLEPFPAPAPPPAPVTEERKKEILADARVVQSQLAGGGGRVREGADAATSVTVPNHGQREVAAAAAAAAPEAAPAAGASASSSGAATAAGVPENVAQARAWIGKWRAEQQEQQQQGGSGKGTEAVPENVADAREWILRWRRTQLEKQLPRGAAANSSR